MLVFWAKDFEEATAATFVAELRGAGLRAKLVGLNAHEMAGIHGLALVTDCTLEEALPYAQSVSAVVLPCDERGFHHIRNDPRLTLFCKQVLDNRALFIVGQFDVAALLHSASEAQATGQILTYPPSAEIATFARTVTTRLLE
ncbi:MAG: DJ-1/PfpI family protein [Anaerolineales bacterium]|nr:DJ-1/PfpI family protein [Anaerolineales bacterium]MCB9129017.1 DJ-1/PfpI family protein [Ardenticatenales bacterium]